MPASGSTAQPRTWVILVARDQPALRAHLRKAFAKDPQVRVVATRKADEPKHSEWTARRLRIHGAVMLRADDYEARYAR